MAADSSSATIASMKQAKSILRQQLKQKLKALLKDDKDLQSAIIQRKILASEVYKSSQRVSIFLPMNDEVNTIPILKSMLDSGKQCFIPHYQGPNMIMVRLESWEAFEKLPSNSWGIKQPDEFNINHDAIFSGGLDLMFMPGLGFTKGGARLGRGKGYYDKYLKKCDEAGKMPHTVALLFNEQLVEDIPTLEHDMLVDSLIYPTQQELDNITD
uniref:5-formyltetrahydrofolate cyclo-ligase n=2 Tax=Arion vulgaris TaxID=1028688 RepID=A0A0B6YZ41_9EUPU